MAILLATVRCRREISDIAQPCCTLTADSAGPFTRRMEPSLMKPHCCYWWTQAGGDVRCRCEQHCSSFKRDPSGHVPSNNLIAAVCLISRCVVHCYVSSAGRTSPHPISWRIKTELRYSACAARANTPTYIRATWKRRVEKGLTVQLLFTRKLVNPFTTWRLHVA